MIRFPILILIVALLGSAAAAAQERQGPLTPPPKREVRRIPLEPKVEPPPLPVEEIVRNFAEKEAAFRRAQAGYSYQQAIRIQESDEEGKAAGGVEAVTEITVTPDGKRIEKSLREPAINLRYTTITVEDLDDLARLTAFLLTPDQLDDYELTYAGKQPLDELTAYIFRVQPKRLERKRGRFEGVIWVDERDLAIVKTYGQMVREVRQEDAASLFTLFETYRENVDGKYWFPAYLRSEQTIKLKNGEARLRLTIRLTDYKAPAPVAK